MRGQDFSDLLLRDAVIPVAVEVADDLDAGVALEHAERLLIVNFGDGRACDAVVDHHLTLAAHLVGHPLCRVGSVASRYVADVVGARFGDSGIIGEHQDVLGARLFDHTVQSRGRQRIHDDGVGASRDHALQIRDLVLDVSTRDHRLELDRLVVGRCARQRLDAVGGRGLPGIAGIAHVEEHLVMILGADRRHGAG